MLGLMSILSLSLIMGILIPDINENTNRKKTYLLIIFGAMFFYSAFRGSNVGIDTYNYKMSFYEIKNYGLWQSFSYLRLEKGYILLNYILSCFSNNAQIVLIITSLFISYSFAQCIYKYSENIVLSTFLYIIFIFSSTMNITRQYVALGFILLSFKYLISKKTIKAGILVVIAILFHNTAIVFLPFLVITMPKFKINTKIISLFCIISTVIVYSFDKGLNLLFRIFPIYKRFMDLQLYSSESDLSIPWLLCYICIFIGAIISIRRENKTEVIDKKNVLLKKEVYNEQSFGLFILLYIAFIISYIFSKRLWIASRMLAYFKPSLCIVLPNVLEKLLPKKSAIKYIVYFLFIAIFFVWGYSMFLKDPHGLLPYNFFKIR